MADGLTLVVVALVVLFAAAAGFAVAHVLGRARHAAGRAERDAEIAGLEAALAALRERLAQEAARAASGEAEQRALTERLSHLNAERADLGARLEGQLERTAQTQALLDDAQTRLAAVFENLAHKALEESNKRSAEANKQQLGTMLDPLREQLREFRQAVTDTHAREQRERGMLAEQIQSLRQLNQQISQDAINLTRALKGESKTQGMWGELVLDRLLEASGLTRGREYDLQAALAGDEGLLRPDAIVHLPDGKDIVIDAKVTLTDYERCCAAVDDDERAVHRVAHLVAMRRHIQSLSERNYSGVAGLRTLDFVLMFVPVEAAFIEAVREDGELYDYALRRNIALVSPSTLLATLRTVAHLWSLEKRNVNAQEIARQAASLYDKFVGLVGDLDTIGDQARRMQAAYERARGKLVTGKDNLVRKVERLRELGVTPTKSLPPSLRDAALENDAGDGDDDDAESTALAALAPPDASADDDTPPDPLAGSATGRRDQTVQ